MPASDHFSGSRFHNRRNAAGYSLWDEIRIAWELRTKKRNWPARFETKPYVAPAEPVLKGIRVLWVGHSTTLIQTPHLSVLTDPILFDSIGPGVFGLHTVTNPGLRIDSLRESTSSSSATIITTTWTSGRFARWWTGNEPRRR